MFKILIAEDERDILELITFTLQYGGYEVIPTSNGLEAWEVIRRELPHLVLLDVRMPGMSGYEVCKKVKTNPQTKHIPVVFLSAKGQESEINTGYETGAIDYILKPFAPDQLLKRLKELLASHTGEESLLLLEN
ncbi:MAG: response regulator [Anaerolineales bacterium]|nr:response regulator [Anaerolineales bacterium]HUV26202.1 response regulator [Anaerolineales bacterium]